MSVSMFMGPAREKDGINKGAMSTAVTKGDLSRAVPEPAARTRRGWGARKILGAVLISLLAVAIVTFIVIQAVRNRAPPKGDLRVRIVTGPPRRKPEKRNLKKGAPKTPQLGLIKTGAVREVDGEEEEDDGRLLAVVGAEAPAVRWSWHSIAEPDGGLPEVERCFLSATTTTVYLGQLSTTHKREDHCLEEVAGGRVQLVPTRGVRKGPGGEYDLMETRVLLVRHVGMPPLRYMLCLQRPGGKGLAMVTRPASPGAGTALMVDALPSAMEDLEARALCIDVCKALKG